MAQQRVESVVAAKKVGDHWEAALVVNGQFARALVGANLDSLVGTSLLGMFIDRPEGAVVTVSVSTQFDDGK